MTAALALTDVTVWRPAQPRGDRLVILDRITWRVETGERWVVLGPNGSGKTTLLNLIAAITHPSAGVVDVLGDRIGRADLAHLRLRIGFVDPGLARSLSPALTAEEVVLTGATSTVLFFPDRTTDTLRQQARRELERLRCGTLADRAFGRCSQGERKRVLIARALMSTPRLLVLDEPCAGLDLPGRELLLEALDALASHDPALTVVLVTHHLEEIPRSASHALLLRRGAVVAAGRVDDVLTAELLTRCFDLDVAATSTSGRWSAIRASAPDRPQ